MAVVTARFSMSTIAVRRHHPPGPLRVLSVAAIPSVLIEIRKHDERHMFTQQNGFGILLICVCTQRSTLYPPRRRWRDGFVRVVMLFVNDVRLGPIPLLRYSNGPR